MAGFDVVVGSWASPQPHSLIRTSDTPPTPAATAWGNGDYLAIMFWCEGCGPDRPMRLTFQHHKGETFPGWTELDGSPLVVPRWLAQ
jgi:hypothetical protein